MKTNTSLLSQRALWLCGLLIFPAGTVHAQDSFGSDVNQFSIDFVTIGNPGNAAQSETNRSHELSQSDGRGSVDYIYRMSTFAISTDMINKANAAGTLGITRTERSANMPATEVSWKEAARFVNFLNVQAGYSPAYKFEFQPGHESYGSNQDIQLWNSNDSGYNPDNLYRNSEAFYFLPSEDEWFKAGYYDPESGQYFLYATGSDTAPTAVASGTAAGTAVYGGQSGPADVTQAGGLSPYGTMGQSGNTWEWMESALDGVNDSTTEFRSVRGGPWWEDAYALDSSTQGASAPFSEDEDAGFRVASISVIPEPSTLILTVILLGSALLLGRRKSSL